MVELEKVIETFHTEEGSDLVAEYLKRVFPKVGTDKPSDDWTMMATFKLMECVSENATVPEGADCHTILLEFLKGLIDATKPVGEAKTEAEEIPPRPFPTGSPYLNPEEVNWLLKYDKKVKASADYFVKWFRREHSDSCSPLMKDEMIIETVLDTLYKLNRRDPSIVSQLSGPGPSFFKQYEEGTPEEIVIRFLDSSSGRKESASGTVSTGSKPKSGSSSYSSGTYSSRKSNSAHKEELLKERKENIKFAIMGLIFFFPIGIYYIYKVYQLTKEIEAL